MTEQELLERGYRQYKGTDLHVFFNLAICQHAGNCVKGAPAVFDVNRKPWIIPNNADAQHVADVIETCPSGALKYLFEGERLNEV